MPDLDPLAVWGAITGTIALGIQALLAWRDRADVVCALGAVTPNVRFELANLGRQPISVRGFGLMFGKPLRDDLSIPSVWARLRNKHVRTVESLKADVGPTADPDASVFIPVGASVGFSVPVERFREILVAHEVGGMQFMRVAAIRSDMEPLIFGIPRGLEEEVAAARREARSNR
jgi:hypothetical protein